MSPPVIDLVPDLERLTQEFERVWKEAGEAALAEFLPSRNHPYFDRIACELICIDMELRWSQKRPKSLDDYRNEFPDLFRNAAILQELGYEDYRQHILAGRAAKPAEYRDRYGIDVSNWTPPPEFLSVVGTERTQVLDRAPVVSPISSMAEVRAAVVGDLRRSLPDAADELDEAIDELPQPGDRVFGFDLVDELGEGAFAKVFRARQSELADRLVALKVAIHLNDEPRKLARLQHTNIVPIYSTHREKHLHAVCMPFLGSLTLDHLLKSITDRQDSLPKSGKELLSTLFDKHSATVENKSNGLPGKPAADSKGTSAVATPILDLMAGYSHIEAVLWMGARVADGLAHAHERGILHLDLKPANILLTDDGQPMLLDFNLSIDLNEVKSIQAARLGGTLPYMSPEQLEAFAGGQRDLDARSDLYSLGIILFEILTGKSPFPRRIGRMNEVVHALLACRKELRPSPRAINPAITPAVDAIISKLLELDRNKRYQSAAELREDLERQLADLPLKFAPDRSLSERARKWQRRHPRLAVACIVSAVAAIFFLMPATAMAVRQNQIAERKKQIETAEAKLLWQESVKEARILQVLLATCSGEKAQFDEGIMRGRAVIDSYGIGQDTDWMKKPQFTRLSDDAREQLRMELGEMLLFMARGEQVRAKYTADVPSREGALRESLRWNELAGSCFPEDQVPRMLGEQRVELAKALSPEANGPSLPARPEGKNTEYDPYHDGVKLATKDCYREGLEFLHPFTEDHPCHYQSWYIRGFCHDHLEENPEAIKCFTVCISLEPTLRHAYFARGTVRLREGKYALANADFTHALELKKDWIEARIHRAIARKGMKEYRGALADLDEVIAKAPSVRVRLLQAEIHELDNKPEEAKNDRAEAMKLQPKDELDWSTRGYVRMNSGPKEPKAALKDYDEAIKLNPRSPEALINKSVVLSDHLDRPREAVEVLDQFLEYYPNHVGARMGRGVVLARIGECKKARQDAEDSLKYDRTPFFLFQAAGLYAQISRHEGTSDAKKEAMALLGSALRKGFSDLDLFQTDADLNPIRNEAEFKRLLEVVAGLKKSAPEMK